MQKNQCLPHLKVKESLRQKSTQDVLGPDPAERQNLGPPLRFCRLFLQLVALGWVWLLPREETLFLVVVLERELGVEIGGARNDGLHPADEELHDERSKSRLALASLQCLQAGQHESVDPDFSKHTSSKPTATSTAHSVRRIQFTNMGSAYGYFISHCTPVAPPKGEFGPNRFG